MKEDKKKLINYEVMENLIINIEQYFETEGLDIEEQQLIIKNINQRLLTKIQKQKINDNISNLNYKDLIGGLMSKNKEE